MDADTGQFACPFSARSAFGHCVHVALPCSLSHKVLNFKPDVLRTIWGDTWLCSRNLSLQPRCFFRLRLPSQNTANWENILRSTVMHNTFAIFWLA